MLWSVVPLILHVISKSLTLSDAATCQDRGGLCTENQYEECATSVETKCSNVATSNPHGDLCGFCHSCVLIRELGQSCGSQLSIRSTNGGSSSTWKVTILATTSCDRGLVCVDSICCDLEASVASSLMKNELEEQMEQVPERNKTEPSNHRGQHHHRHQCNDNEEHSFWIKTMMMLKNAVVEKNQLANETEEIAEKHDETMTTAPIEIRIRPDQSVTEKTQNIYPEEDQLKSIICVQIGNQTFELIFKYNGLNELELLLGSIDKSDSSYHVTKKKAGLLYVLFRNRLKKVSQENSPRSSSLQASRLLAGNYGNYTVIRKTYYKITRLPEEHRLKSSQAVPSTTNGSVFANSTTTKRTIISSLSHARKPSRGALLNLEITRKTSDKTGAFQNVEFPAIHHDFVFSNTLNSSQSRLQSKSVRKKRDVEDEEVDDALEKIKFDVPSHIQDILNVKVTPRNTNYSDMPYDNLNTTLKSANASDLEIIKLSESDKNRKKGQRVKGTGEGDDETLRVFGEPLDHEDVESVVDNRVTDASIGMKMLVDLTEVPEERRKRADNLDNMKMYLDRGNNDSILERNTRRQNENDENGTYMNSQITSSIERETFEGSSHPRSTEREREGTKGTLTKGVRSTVKRIAKNRITNPAASKVSGNDLTDIKEQIQKMKTQVNGLENKIKDIAKHKTQIEQITKRIDVLERTEEIALTLISTFMKLNNGEKSKDRTRSLRHGGPTLNVPINRRQNKYSNPTWFNDEDAGQSILESQFEPMKTEVLVDNRFDNQGDRNVSQGHGNEETIREHGTVKDFEEKSTKCSSKGARNNAKGNDVKKVLEDVIWNLNERDPLRGRRPVFRQEQEKPRHYGDVMAMKELERQVDPSVTDSASLDFPSRDSDVLPREAFDIRGGPAGLSTRLLPGGPITGTMLQNRPIQHSIWSLGPMWNRSLDRRKRRSKEVTRSIRKHVETQIPKPKVQSVSSGNEKEGPSSARKTQDQSAGEIVPDSRNDENMQNWKGISEEHASFWKSFLTNKDEGSSASRTLSKSNQMLPTENPSENLGQESRLDQFRVYRVPPRFNILQGQRYSNENHDSPLIRNNKSRSVPDFRLNEQIPLPTQAALPFLLGGEAISHAKDIVPEVQMERNDTSRSKDPSNTVLSSSDGFVEIGRRFNNFENSYHPEESNLETKSHDYLLQKQRKFANWKNCTVRRERATGVKSWTRDVEENYDRLQNRSYILKTLFSKESASSSRNPTNIDLFTREVPSDSEKYSFMGILEEKMRIKPKKLFSNDNDLIRDPTQDNGSIISNELLDIPNNKSNFDTSSKNSKSNIDFQTKNSTENQDVTRYSIKTSNNSSTQVERETTSLNDREVELHWVGTTEKPAELRFKLVLPVPDEDFEHMYESIEAEDGDFDYTDLNFTNSKFDDVEYIDGSNVEIITMTPLFLDHVTIEEQVKKQIQDLPVNLKNCRTSECKEKWRKGYRSRSDVHPEEDDKLFMRH